MSEVQNAGRQKVGQGDGEGLRRFVELGGTSWGDASRREVGLGDREVLERSIKLYGVGRSPEVNNKAGRAESVSITDNVGLGKRKGKHSPQT